jgi:UDP:flavonoid glycosyltransferase YjiC (YdhE family)
VPRILLGHDFGDGLGHVAVLGPIARALQEAGATCLMALSDPIMVLPALDRLGVPFVQAPHHPLRLRGRFEGRLIASFADLMTMYSCDSEPGLRARVQAWDGLIGAFEPDLIIADFAPILCLAAYARRPVVLVGSGYTTPPSNLSRFPRIRELPNFVEEADLLALIRRVQAHRRAPAPPTLPGLFAAEATFITQLDILDPYGTHRSEPAAGPLLALPPPAEGPPATGYFAYLAASYAGTAIMLEALLESGLEGSVYLREADAGTIARWRARGLVMHGQPVAMAEVAGRAGVVVHHGGVGTAETVLALGRPQLFVPRHVEQVLNGRAVARLEVAGMMRSAANFSKEQAVEGLRSMTLPPVPERARAEALRLRSAGHAGSLARIRDACLAIAAGGRP